MDEGEDVEDLLICDEPDVSLQCSTCQRECATVEEKDRHEDTSARREDRIKFMLDQPCVFDVNMSYPELAHFPEDKDLPIQPLDWAAPKALALFFAEGSLDRVLLSSSLSEAKGLNGITHDMLYQTICFMADWALCSDKGFVHRMDYMQDPEPWRAKCTDCMLDAAWKCKTCKNGSETCRCNAKKKIKHETNKVMFTPPIDWACKTCQKGEHACNCKLPIKVRPEKRHVNAYYVWVAEKDAKCPKDYKEKMAFAMNIKDRVRKELLGRQKTQLAYYCAVHHFPDIRHPSMSWMVGEKDQLGIKGRWQWSEEQVSISSVLQAIDMLLMILALPQRSLEISPGALPYVAMMCLMLQIHKDADNHLKKVLAKIDAAMPYEFGRSDYVKMYRTIYIHIFQFVLPGSTILGDTSAMWWMRPASNFQVEEDRSSRILFQVLDYVPHIDNKTLEETKPACPLFIRAPKTVVMRPSAYNRLFESYCDRQKWIERFKI